MSLVTRERTERFIKNLISALGHCILKDGEVLGFAIIVLACVGIFWLVGMGVYELFFDPHVTTLAALDPLSIAPDKWIPR